MEKFTRSKEQCISCACYIENVSGEVKKELARCGNECTYGLFICKALLACPVFSAGRKNDNSKNRAGIGSCLES